MKKDRLSKKNVAKSSDQGELRNNKKLKIAIDCYPLSDNNPTGIPVVVVNILNALKRIDLRNEYYLIFDGINRSVVVDRNNWHVIENFKLFCSMRKFLDQKGKIVFWGKLFKFLSKVLKLISLALFHSYQIFNSVWLYVNGFDVYIITSSHYKIFSMFKKPIKIVFVYDLVWKFYPETMEKYNRIFMKMFAKRNMQCADCLIAISDSTRKDLMTVIKADKPIVVMPLAADKNTFYPASQFEIQRIKKQYGIKNKYLLSVATIEPRKNLFSLLKAISMMKNTNIQLVLTGKVGWINKEFFKELDCLKIKDKIVFTGYVPMDDLAPLYSGAEIFIYPSIYEGFGLPILEAFQCGVPVITSVYSAMPEVAGDAALLVDTKDPMEIYKAIIYLMKNPSLKKLLRKRGMRRSKEFSWENSAEILRKTMEQLCK